MKIGKLTNKELNSIILSNVKQYRDDVVLRPGIGIDCGGIKIGDDVCMLSCDPITAASKDAGKIAVHVSCNDVAATGASPIALLVTMLIPPTSTVEEIAQLFKQMQDTAFGLNVEIIGGHTEITDAVNKIVICTTVIGKTKLEKYVCSNGAKVGDSIIMTKFAAMEGTAIIASDCAELIKDFLSDDEINLCKSLVENISVVREGQVASELNVSAMHDVTEGGILQAVCEVCEASNYGAIINIDDIPVLNETRKICTHLNINPYRLMSSGSMIITTKNGDDCVDNLLRQGIPAKIIGKIKEGNILTISNGVAAELIPQERDELYKVINLLKK